VLAALDRFLSTKARSVPNGHRHDLTRPREPATPTRVFHEKQTLDTNRKRLHGLSVRALTEARDYWWAVI
jgi:hypothetical protein